MPTPVLRRIIRRERPDAHGTLVVLLLHGGMGDRIVFEAVVRDAVERVGERTRIIAAIPPHGNDYDARRYPTPADQVWIVESPRAGTPVPIAEGVHLTAQDAFGWSGEVSTHCYGPPLELAPEAAGLTWRELYSSVVRIAREGGSYPRFVPSQAAQEEAAAWRAALDAGGAPLVAIHCRTRADLAERNPSPEDVVAATVALRVALSARVIACGADDVPPGLAARADGRLMDPDPTLDRTGARLAACDLFVGGESGPLHLAAAVGVPVVLLAHPRRGGGAWGPFLPPRSWREVTCEIGAPGEGLRLDPAAVVSAASALLAASARPAGPPQVASAASTAEKSAR